MWFKQIIAAFLASLLGAQSAAIAIRGQAAHQEQDSGQVLVLLTSEITPVGNLTIWGVPDTEDSATTTTTGIIDDVVHSDVDRRCGSNQVQCSGSNTAPTNVCAALIGSLSDAGVNTAPRSICLSQSGYQCCISWANPVPGLVQSQLRNAANKASAQCGGGGTVSAKALDVNLRGVCTTQCLSNRPNGCV